MIRTRWTGIACAAVIALLPTLGSRDAVAQPKMEATLATVNAATFLIVRMESLFAEKVKEKTNGGLTITVVTDGQLGGIQENVEAIMAGNLELAQINNANLGAFHSGTMLFDLPFVFRDNNHMRNVVRGDIGKQVYGEFEKKTGVRLFVTGIADGPRSVWNRNRPVVTPADMKGLKLRVMQAPILVDTFTALGAIPTPMAYPEVYMAAKQGVIDGADTPPAGLIDMKAPEIAKYYSLTAHVAMPSGIAMNAKWFDSLPKSYQDAMVEAATEASAWYDTTYDDDAAKAIGVVESQGMVVNKVADADAFRTAVKGVYEKYAQRVGGQGAIDAVLAVK